MKLRMGIQHVILISLFNLLCLKNAQAVCSSNLFECVDGKRCIPMSWKCDGSPDCADQSDEDPLLCRISADSIQESCNATSGFLCDTGLTCISQRFLCDGFRDCPDGSDELDHRCREKGQKSQSGGPQDEVLEEGKRCKEGQFQCLDGTGQECLPEKWVCDGHSDCLDGSDELNCNRTCQEDEFTCSKDGSCISSFLRCDGDPDCRDGSDEVGCPTRTCDPQSQFTCVSGDQCISSAWRCDGDRDCSDGSDEVDCPRKPSTETVCKPQEWLCANKLDCVHKSWVCDGDRDCPDGSDESEERCPVKECRPDQFKCTTGECIPEHLVCSGVAECSDGSDESANCTRPESSCDPIHEFRCTDGSCIRMDLACNGVSDCPTGEDEPGAAVCGVNECLLKKRNGVLGPCSHGCLDLKVGFLCTCPPGYATDSEGTTCVDIDECSTQGSCSQVCINTPGSFRCECLPGYAADHKDPTRCKASTDQLPILMLANRHDVRTIEVPSDMMEREDMKVLVHDTKDATALDFHVEKQLVFWSDVFSRRIYRTSLTSEDAATVLFSEDVSSDSLAVDWLHDHIYWTDSRKNSILVSDLKGEGRVTLISEDLGEPRAIALDPVQRFIFWTDVGSNPRLERSALDGSDRRVLISSDIRWPNGITLDLLSRRVYWVDAKMNLIASCDYDGANRKTVLYSPENLHKAFSVTLFEDRIFWTEWANNSVHSANKFDGSDYRLITASHKHSQPRAISIYHDLRQPTDSAASHACAGKDHGCEHLCLPPALGHRSSPSTCFCGDGYALNNDGKTCRPNKLLTNGFFHLPSSEVPPPLETTASQKDLLLKRPQALDPSELNDRAGRAPPMMGTSATNEYAALYYLLGGAVLVFLVPVIFVVYKRIVKPKRAAHHHHHHHQKQFKNPSFYTGKPIDVEYLADHQISDAPMYKAAQEDENTASSCTFHPRSSVISDTVSISVTESVAVEEKASNEQLDIEHEEQKLLRNRPHFFSTSLKPSPSFPCASSLSLPSSPSEALLTAGAASIGRGSPPALSTGRIEAREALLPQTHRKIQIR